MARYCCGSSIEWKNFWDKIFSAKPTRKPFNRNEAKILSDKIEKEIEVLKNELQSPDSTDKTEKVSFENSSKESSSSELKFDAKKIKAGVGKIEDELKNESVEREEKYVKSKIDFLLQHILDYQSIFRDLAHLSGGDAYLFLDDLYHIRRNDQARLLDYFHRIAKANGLWLKIGTIRHRSSWYVQGDPPIGMKIGDDADEIDLDLTLEKYQLAKRFLMKVLSNLTVDKKDSSIKEFMTHGALDRLVLASGGVARDFLSIFRRSVEAARVREGKGRGDRVGAEDVNVAAGEFDSIKREEFNRDTMIEDARSLELEFQNLQRFCLNENNCNCFLLNKDLRNETADMIHELVDLKLIHLVRSRVTVSSRPGKVFEAYMLDLSQYAGARKRRDLNLIEFWKDSSKEDLLRKSSLIYGEKESRIAANE